MARQYNKVQELLERILERHANGETYREIVTAQKGTPRKKPDHMRQ